MKKKTGIPRASVRGISVPPEEIFERHVTMFRILGEGRRLPPELSTKPRLRRFRAHLDEVRSMLGAHMEGIGAPLVLIVPAPRVQKLYGLLYDVLEGRRDRKGRRWRPTPAQISEAEKLKPGLIRAALAEQGTPRPSGRADELLAGSYGVSTASIRLARGPLRKG